MRIPSKPSSARCTVDLYTLFLMSEPKLAGCCRLSQIMDSVSHDSINRFLQRERFEPKDLFLEFQNFLTPGGGILSVDDVVLDKPYSDPSKTDLVGHFWSGKHHKVVLGLNIITLYYCDIHGKRMPINYRIYDKSEGKTKNEYFREMVLDILSWGIMPAMVTGDSWYSSTENLKFLRNQKLGFLFGVEKNRIISNNPRAYQQVQVAEIPEEGLFTHLKDFGFVRVYRQTLHGQARHYISWLPETERLEKMTRLEFQQMHDTHWGIEQFHRAIKQVCHIEKFMVRQATSIRTHIFCSLRAFVCLEMQRATGQINNWYALQRSLFTQFIRAYLDENLKAVLQAGGAYSFFSVNA